MTSFFLHPWLLAALAAVFLPPIIEWLFRRRKRRIELPTIRFLLDNQEQKKVRRQDQLLLLLRMLAIGLLIFSIARPLWKQGGLDGPRQRNVVLLLDATASMSQQLDVSTSFALAQKKAAAVVRSLPADTAVTVASFSDRVLSVVEGETDLHTVAARIEALKTGCGGTSVSTALGWVRDYVKEKRLEAAELYIFSDFQKYTWKRDSSAQGAAQVLQELGGVCETYFVDVGGPSQFNLMVTHLRPIEFVMSVGMPVTFQAAVEARGDIPANTKSTATFLVDGVKKDAREVSPAASGTALSFDYVFPKAGEYLVEVAIDGDRHRLDNRRQYLCKVPENARVLIVDDSADTALPASAYLARAIRPPTHPGVDKLSHFDVKTVHPARLSYENLGEYVVVAVAASANVNEAVAAQFERFVSDGGALWFFMGDAVNAYDYQRLFYNEGKGLLPCTLAGAENIAAPGANEKALSLLYGEANHPALAQLARTTGSSELAPRRRMKLSLALPSPVGRFSKPDIPPASLANDSKKTQTDIVNSVQENATAVSDAGSENRPPVNLDSAESAKTIIRFSDGEPALVEKNFGRGRVLLANFSVGPEWSYLPALTEFPLLVQGVLSYLVGEPDRAVNLSVGERFEQPVFVSTQHLLLRVPQGSPVRLTPDKNELRKGEFRVSFADTAQPGLYEIDAMDEVLPRRRFVVNHEAAEGDLDRLAATEVTELFPVRSGGWIPQETALDEFTAQLHTVTELAPWILSLLAAVLAFETFFAWRFGRRRGGAESSSPP